MHNLHEDNNGNLEIFVDQPELNKVVLDFTNYIDALSNIIKFSSPHYTVGIFGEWGTGKTTLLENIRKQLEQEKINCINFNAWRFEGEKRIATYPIMLTILENLLELPEIQRAFNGNKFNKKSFGEKIKHVLDGIAITANVGIPGIGMGINYAPSNTQEFNDFEDIRRFYQKNKPTLQEGVELIQQDLLPIIEGYAENPRLKLVIFIDDLDRCTPEKASEILESIKIFFDIEGIVFVLGLSKAIVEAAIDFKYEYFKKVGIFSGSDYIKKIIQVPFVLPRWNTNDLDKFVESILENYSNKTYQKFFLKNKQVILETVENNPRDVKRLLNNFILIHNIFNRSESNENVEENTNEFNLKLFTIQALTLRWNWFVEELFVDFTFIQRIKNILYPPMTNKAINVIEHMAGPKDQYRKDPLEEKLYSDNKLAYFLMNSGKTILTINEDEWKKLRRTTPIILEFNDEITMFSGLSNNEKLSRIEKNLEKFQSGVATSIPYFKESLKKKPLNKLSKEYKVWEKDHKFTRIGLFANIRGIIDTLIELKKFEPIKAKIEFDNLLSLLNHAKISEFKDYLKQQNFEYTTEEVSKAIKENR